MTAEDPRHSGGQAKFPEIRTQAQVTPNKKATQTTRPTFPSKGGGWGRKKEYDLQAWERRPQVEQGRKKMMKRQINTAQMKEQGRNLQDLINERK